MKLTEIGPEIKYFGVIRFVRVSKKPSLLAGLLQITVQILQIQQLTSDKVTATRRKRTFKTRKRQTNKN